MEKQKYHTINRGGHTIIYDVESLELYCGDNVLAKELRMLETQKFESTAFSNANDILIAKDDNSKGKARMRRITLCVSNDCNLRCKYCYANGGNYGKKCHLMDKKTVKKFVDFCVTNFSSVGTVLFFGGEPLLNYPIIEYICELFKQYAMCEDFPLPSFSIITNGTLCNEKILKLLRDTISHITISIDGDKKINDKNRIYKNGEGCYDKIERFIFTCKDIPSQKLQFEATYTSEHIKLGITRYDVSSFLKNRFGINGIVVDEDSLDKRLMHDYLCSITKEKLLQTDFECLPLDFWKVMYTITTKSPNTFCGIFYDRITITSEGGIAGCQMMIGNDKSIIAYINDTGALKKIKHQIRDFKNNPVCENCWCTALCGGCVAQKFYSKTYGGIQFLPDHDTCEWTRLYIEEILYLIFNIRKDKELWPLFIDKAKLRYNS